MTSCQCYHILFPTINALFQSPVIQSTISNPLFLSSFENSSLSTAANATEVFMPAYVKKKKKKTSKLGKSDLTSTHQNIYNRPRLDHSNNNQSWISSLGDHSRSLTRPLDLLSLNTGQWTCSDLTKSLSSHAVVMLEACWEPESSNGTWLCCWNAKSNGNRILTIW